jgi:hypothetical protein
LVPLAGLSAGAELPAGPGEEGDGHQERDDRVGGQAVTSVPEENELDDEEGDDGKGDEERHAAAVTVGTHAGVNLTVDVELVEPDDNQDGDDTEHDVQGQLGRLVTGGHKTAIHTIDEEDAYDRDGEVDEPRVIYEAREAIGASADVGSDIGLGEGKEVEADSQEDEADNEVSPESAAANLGRRLRDLIGSLRKLLDKLGRRHSVSRLARNLGHISYKGCHFFLN